MEIFNRIVQGLVRRDICIITHCAECTNYVLIIALDELHELALKSPELNIQICTARIIFMIYNMHIERATVNAAIILH